MAQVLHLQDRVRFSREVFDRVLLRQVRPHGVAADQVLRISNFYSDTVSGMWP